MTSKERGYYIIPGTRPLQTRYIPRYIWFKPFLAGNGRLPRTMYLV